MSMEDIKILYNKVVSGKCSPLERCWAIRNAVGTITGRYDKADEIGAMICDLIIPYMPKDKMLNKQDDDCTEYWHLVRSYLLNGR